MEPKTIAELVKKLQEQQHRLNRSREAADRARQEIQRRQQFNIKVQNGEFISRF